MRVLYFSRDYTTHDWRFLTGLAASRHEIWFLRLQDGGTPFDERPLPSAARPIEWAGGRGPQSNLDDWLELMPDFETVLQAVRPDLVHAGPVQSCGFMTALLGRYPLLLMSWGSDMLVEAESNDLYRWITRYTLERSVRLLCDCDAVRDQARRLAAYPDARIVQFPWGVDLACFRPDGERATLRERPGWQDAFIILSTRSWEPLYGIDVLLDAFERAYRQDERLRLALLGTGSLTETIEQRIRERGLAEVIHRPGVIHQAELPGYFRAADLYVSCSKSDGSSVSLLEALASGLPVVVTDAAGNREWVQPGENGWLAAPGDAEGFAQAILEAANLTADARGEMAWRNRRVAEARANWDQNFPALLAAYDEIEAEHVR